MREKQGKDNKMPWVDICRYCRLTSIGIELSGILMLVGLVEFFSEVPFFFIYVSIVVNLFC